MTMLRADGSALGVRAYQNYLNLAAQIPINAKEVVFRLHYMQHFLPRNNSRILDLGAYLGANMIHYGLLGHTVEGVEGAARYVERFHEEMENLPSLPIYMHHCMIQDFQPEGEFDYVICGEVLEHAPNPQEIIQKAHDCLRPGGTAFFCVLNHKLPPHINLYSRDTLREEMRGFKKLRSIDTGDHFTCQGVK